MRTTAIEVQIIEELRQEFKFHIAEIIPYITIARSTYCNFHRLKQRVNEHEQRLQQGI